MIIKIALETKDYLAYHLFLASKSDSLKKRRFLHWFSVPLMYIVTGIVFVYLNGAEIVRTIFFVTAGLWFIFYPFYSKWAVGRFLLRQVNARYANLVGKEGGIHLTEKKIIVKGHDASMDIDYKDVKDIIELPDHFFIDLNIGSSLILPKQKIEAKMLAEAIKKISAKTGIEPKAETLWGWK
jgi:hypothetical protein